MKKILSTLIVVCLILPIFLTIATMNANAATQSSNKVFLGLSGYPTSTSQVQSIINTMQANGLNTFRMSFNPTWSSGPHPYRLEYIQYFLDHSNFNIIVDRNHLYPPQESSASAARSNWATVRSSLYDVLEAFPNNPRVAVELINEYISDDFYSRMQGLVTEIRNAGYTNAIVVDKWNQPWTVINDPLDNTYQGYHYYFNSWSPSGAISQMQTAQSKGIKLINTEVGADYNEYSSFTTSTVSELNQFLTQCASMGIGNTVWMNENLNNWARYQSLGLDFPSVTAPGGASPTPTPTPTTTPRPTATPTPTPTTTPKPTQTPSPTPTQTPTPTPTPTTPPPSTSTFEDDFESGTTSSWSSTTRTSRDTVAISENMPFNGDYSARFYTSGSSYSRENAFLRKRIAAENVFASAQFRITGSSSGSTILRDNNDRFYLLRFTNNNGADLALAGIRRENGVNKWILFAGNTYKSSTAIPISTNQWYNIQLHWDSEQNIAEMYVNGEKILQINVTSGDTSSATYAEMGILYTYRVQNSLQIYGDNFKLSSVQ